ncbi:DNA translocase FtsK [bacterium]|nr:DNA translocase FtsK [bacterium]NCQ54956.1 DNA translocase FtsK [Candidatus Parcubacteria bacterium]NCS67000.1 DNA translocase FtsK [Candidatus Peregrinibacteria bacterium]NCS95946.1 DNA translocase FtsK [bacterium]
MLSRKKKAPSVKIPSSVLKREAEKAAKRMIEAERKKERNKELKSKAKAKATKKVETQKAQKEEIQAFFANGFQREIIGSSLIGLGLILLAIFFSEAPAAQWIHYEVFRALFGATHWLLPFGLMGFGGLLFWQKEILFPAPRIMALMLFVVSICGLANLLVPHTDSLALENRYGGALGFAIGFFPREYFGDMVAGVFLLILFWVSGVIAFGVSVRELFKRVSAPKEVETGISLEKNSKQSVAKSVEASPTGRFENEVEIIDSSAKLHASKPAKTAAPKPVVKDLTLEEKDALTEAKNKSFGNWEPPHLDLLENKVSTITVDEKKLRQKAESIREKLDQFGIEVTMKSVHVGPTVTQFTLDPAAGVKLNKITTLKSDLALALAAPSVRIEAPIRGKKLVGIEIPNEKRATVGMREILESDFWESDQSGLKLAVGRDVAGKPVVVDLAKMPHLLIAGKTGSGKSVAMNAFLVSLLWNNSPEDLRMILIDPKRVELEPYNNLPHLLTPVITEPEKSVSALAWAVAEMNRRYKDFAAKRCRNISEYNEKNPDIKEPYIVIVIDELADLMMVAGKDVEAAICRIAQMARAVGMHLIVATQRPSVDVVTGLIKANLPARIAFRVSSGIDSRVIIDGVGAEDLLGFGDMLYLDGNSGDLSRIQGLYVANEEVERITNHIKLQFPEMIANDEITAHSIEGMAKGGVLTAGLDKNTDDDNLDDLFNDAVNVVLETGKASASFLQRRLEVGYARAARLLDQMESRGIVGPARGAKPREIYGRPE